MQLDGVISIHELHVWQLSDTKLIASLHVLLKSREIYMTLGSQIRKLLHGYGIHSATIQPEFIDDQFNEKKALQIEEGPGDIESIRSSPSLHALTNSIHGSSQEVNAY